MNRLFVISPNVAWTTAALFAVLAAGTVIRLCTLRGATQDVAKDRLGSLKSWWLLAIVLSLAVFIGPIGACVLFTVVSLLAMHEFAKLTGVLEHDRSALWVFALIPINYLWIFLGWYYVFVVFVPLVVFLVIAARKVSTGCPQGFIRQTANLHWGMTLTVFCLSHAVLLFALPEESNPVAGVAGWFLFLVILTEANDILQALIGRRIGGHKIVPHVSPNKTWEGFVCGGLATIVPAVLLAPWLTPLCKAEFIPWLASAEEACHVLRFVPAAIAGLLIAVTGFLGDLTMSSVKRDVGVKDSGSLLPGQGGILDRIDSLTFSAPAFYYFVVLISRG